MRKYLICLQPPNDYRTVEIWFFQWKVPFRQRCLQHVAIISPKMSAMRTSRIHTHAHAHQILKNPWYNKLSIIYALYIATISHNPVFLHEQPYHTSYLPHNNLPRHIPPQAIPTNYRPCQNINTSQVWSHTSTNSQNTHIVNILHILYHICWNGSTSHIAICHIWIRSSAMNPAMKFHPGILSCWQNCNASSPTTYLPSSVCAFVHYLSLHPHAIITIPSPFHPRLLAPTE